MSTLTDQTAAWDATETAARIAAGEVSAAEVVAAAIARARASSLGAVATEDYDRALAVAGSPSVGPFAGVPTYVKDLEDYEGLPTLFGSAALTPGPAKATAPVLQQLLSTGLISLGKSTTAEFGLTATTEPVHGEPTRNPRNQQHSAGGSSGGAAALVAGGVVPIAQGGDGGGSIRIPAAFCGLVGLKPSRGRLIDLASANRMPVKIAVPGVLTRSVRDTATFFASVDQQNAKLPPVGLVEGPGGRTLRIGLFVDSPLGTPLHPEIRAAVERTGAALESFGHSVEPTSAPYGAALAEDFVLHWALLAMGVEALVKSSGELDRLEPWTRGLASHARGNWWKLPGAIWRLRRFPHKYSRAFDRFDVLLSPTTAQPAPRLGELSAAQSFDEKLPRLLSLLPYTPVQNAAGAPAISLPAGTTKGGLPIGVQLAAPLGDERTLLELAFALEGAG